MISASLATKASLQYATCLLVLSSSPERKSFAFRQDCFKFFPLLVTDLTYVQILKNVLKHKKIYDLLLNV